MKRRRNPDLAKMLDDNEVILAALTKASLNELTKHARAGIDIPVMRDGKVVLVPAQEELQRALARNAEANGTGKSASANATNLTADDNHSK